MALNLDFLKKFKKDKHTHRNNVIIYGKPGYEKITESFNRLKDNILYFNLDNKVKVIQICSATSNEGKTTILTNLAVSLARNEKKVVIVDCDLRAPKVHRAFNLDNEIGISNYMLNDKKIEEVVCKTSYNVDVISRGNKIENPSALLSSDKFKTLIDTLKDTYDYVLIDCPPVLEISDYMQISTVSDGLLYTVAYGQTKKAAVKEAVSYLKQSKINILGVVYTMVDDKRYKGNGYYLAYENYYNTNSED